MKHTFRILAVSALALLGLLFAFAPAEAQSTSILTIDLSGSWNNGVTVELWNSDQTTKLWGVNNQNGAVRTYNVPQGTYDLKLASGPHQVWFELDCNIDCNPGVVKQTLSVDLDGTWNAGVTVELYADGGGKIWGVNHQNGSLRTYNVLKGDYDLKLKSGPHTLSLDVDCKESNCDAGIVKRTLTVDLDGTWNAGVTVELFADGGDKIWGVNHQNGSLRTYNVLKGDYDLKLLNGPHTLSLDVDCKESNCDAGIVKQTLTVDLEGAWNAGVTVELYANDSGKIWGVNHQNGSLRTFNVLKGVYDLKLMSGPHEYWVYDIPCTSDCDAGIVKQTLTVDLEGAWNAGVTVELYANDSGKIWGVNHQNNVLRTYNVLKGTYDLRLVQGPKIKDVPDIICQDHPCSAGDVISQLALNLTPNTGVTTKLHVTDGQSCTAGGQIWSVNNQSGTPTYNVLKNTYDVSLVIGGKTYVWDDVSCTGESCTLDKSTLTVNFPGISSVHVYAYASNGVAGTVSGSAVASQTNTTDKVTFTNLPNGKYDLRIVQGGMVKIVDDVLVMGNCASVDNIVATLTVDFPGLSGIHTYVRANDGVDGTAAGGGVAEATHKTGSATIAVLKGVYDVRVQQGSQTNVYDNVDCTNDTCSISEIVNTLTVNFPGLSGIHSYVRANDGVGGTAAGGGVAEATHKTGSATIAVLEGVYDVRVQQGSQVNVYDAVDCTDSGPCLIDGIVRTLTVNFPGLSGIHSYVRANDGVGGTAAGGGVAEVTHKTGSATIALLKGTYDVRVQQGSQVNVYDAVDCTDSGPCLIDGIVATLTVNFPGLSGIHSYVRANGGGVAEATHKTGSATIAVLKGTYDVRVQQGAKTNVYDAVDCTGDTCTINDIVATLTVTFPGMSGVHTYVKTDDNKPGQFTGGNVSNSTHKTNSTTIALLKGFYDVNIEHGANSYLYDAVDCTGNTCTLDKSSLTVYFPGINGLHLYLYQSNNVAGTVSGSVKAQQTYKNDQAVFTNLSNGKYDLRLVQGGMTMIIDDIVVLGNFATVNNIVATLTVNFPDINGVHTYVKTVDNVVGGFSGANVTQTTYKNDTTSMVVLKGFYDVRVVQGGQGNVYDSVNCTSGSCLITDIVATLTVNFPGISGAHTYVKTDSGGAFTGGNVTQTTYKNDSTTLKVLKGQYDVKVVQGAQGNVYQANCTSGTCSINDIVATLTVDFPGLSGIHTYVKTDDGTSGAFSGGNVTQKTYQNETATLIVLKGEYDVKVVQGAQGNVYDVDCSDGSCSIDNIVTTLTVDFPGLSGIHTYVKTDSDGAFTGGNVTQKTYQNGSAELVVLKGNFYDVKVVQGAQGNVYEVDCTDSDTCAISDIVRTLSVNFPGISGAHIYVKTDDGSSGNFSGGNVTQKTYQNGAAAMTVLKGNHYDVQVVQGGQKNVYDVDCDAGTCTIDNIVVTLTVNFPGFSGVHTYVKTDDSSPGVFGGSNVTQKTYQNTSTAMTVLKGFYDVRIVKGTTQEIYDSVNCSSADCAVN